MSVELINGAFALGGAIIGALVAGFFSWRAALLQVEKKELVCDIGGPENVIKTKTEVGLDIQVSFAGTVIDALQRTEIKIYNSGNRAIDNALISLIASEHRALFEVVPQKDSLLHEKIIEIQRKIGSKLNKSQVDIQIRYINPKELFEFSLFYQGTALPVDATFRGKDVSFRKTNQKNDMERNFDAIISILGSMPGGAILHLLLRSTRNNILKKTGN